MTRSDELKIMKKMKRISGKKSFRRKKGDRKRYGKQIQELRVYEESLLKEA